MSGWKKKFLNKPGLRYDFPHKNLGCCLIGHLHICNLAAASTSIHTPGINMLYLVFDLKQKPSSFAEILLTHCRASVDPGKRINMPRQQLLSSWNQVCSSSRSMTLYLPSSPSSSSPARDPWTGDRRGKKLVHEGDVGDRQSEGLDS